MIVTWKNSVGKSDRIPPLRYRFGRDDGGWDGAKIKHKDGTKNNSVVADGVTDNH